MLEMSDSKQKAIYTTYNFYLLDKLDNFKIARNLTTFTDNLLLVN